MNKNVQNYQTMGPNKSQLSSGPQPQSQQQQQQQPLQQPQQQHTQTKDRQLKLQLPQKSLASSQNPQQIMMMQQMQHQQQQSPVVGLSPQHYHQFMFQQSQISPGIPSISPNKRGSGSLAFEFSGEIYS
jgi:hypothetical protein